MSYSFLVSKCFPDLYFSVSVKRILNEGVGTGIASDATKPNFQNPFLKDPSSLVHATANYVLEDYNASFPLATASIGKLLLLLKTATLLEEGSLSQDELLSKDSVSFVSGAGTWQHLLVPSLPIEDLCFLIAMTSDNLATNVLLKRVGLQAVKDFACSLGLTSFVLYDFVRDTRSEKDPKLLSSSSSEDLTSFFLLLVKESFGSFVSQKMRSWLSTGADLSLASFAFDLDPLHHFLPTEKVSLFNKTGSDSGVLAEAGFVMKEEKGIAYACIINWDSSLNKRKDALSAMHLLGKEIHRLFLEITKA